MALIIKKAKPNPAGKDRVSRTLALNAQLAAEWVDIRNDGASPLALSGVELYHYAYLSQGGGEWQKVTPLSGALGAGMTVRVHSGDVIPLTQLRQEDLSGADYHVFSGKDYVWNNKRPDFPRLWYTPTRAWLDQTTYDAPVPEGRILTRINEKLV